MRPQQFAHCHSAEVSHLSDTMGHRFIKATPMTSHEFGHTRSTRFGSDDQMGSEITNSPFATKTLRQQLLRRQRLKQRVQLPSMAPNKGLDLSSCERTHASFRS
jgi:hypothetical protein